MPRFVDNIDAIVNKIGTTNVGLVWGLANMNWADDAERDDFIDMLVLPRDDM